MEVKRKNAGYRYTHRDGEDLYSVSGHYPLDHSNTAKELEYDFETPGSQSVQRSRSRAAARKRRKRQVQRMRRRARALATALAIIIAFGAIAGQSAQVHLVKGAQITALQDEIKGLDLENDGLKRQVDELSSIQHIEQAALAMGMKKPGGTIYVKKNLLDTKSGVENSAWLSQNPPGLPAETASGTRSDEDEGVLEKALGLLVAVITDH